MHFTNQIFLLHFGGKYVLHGDAYFKCNRTPLIDATVTDRGLKIGFTYLLSLYRNLLCSVLRASSFRSAIVAHSPRTLLTDR